MQSCSLFHARMATNMLLHVTLLLLLTVCSSNGQDSQSSCTIRGDVRLIGGRNSREGRVEVCLNGEWGTVCDDLWDDQDAAVVCRQLGFSANGAIGISRAHFGEGNGTIHLDNVACVGEEGALSDCPQQGLNPNCAHGEDASVICLPENFTCPDGHIRLADSNNEYEGRVEICFNNRYGTVCDDGWDNVDASVVCGQLGFQRKGAIGVGRSQLFGSGFGVIYFDDVACTGNETNLTECSHRGVGVSNCFHGEDVGVICESPGGPTVCNNTDLRLVNGRTSNEGRVEVCYNNNWGTICDDFWDALDAQVVCRQMGFATPANASIALVGGAFGAGEGIIFLDSVQCSGGESSLSECPSDPLGTNNCGHTEDAAVFCHSGETICKEGNIRLADGPDGREYEGRLEICINNHWGTVCDDRYNVAEARVVCRQLGFTNGSPLPLPGAFFGQGVGMVWLDELDCTGTEMSLLECGHSGVGKSNCGHLEDVSIICPLPEDQPKDCENGNVRLVGGAMSSEGRVEICFNGRWGTVCDDGWGQEDAAVVCNQLGYDLATTNNSLAAVEGLFGSGEGPILLDNVMCSGEEESILACHAEELGMSNCFHTEDAGVVCPTAMNQRLCEDGEIRLVGGAGPSEGRVEMCFNSRWGSVCAPSFDNREAQVTCRNLGFDMDKTRSVPILSGGFGKASTPFFLRALGCVGTEETFLQCPRASVTLSTSCGLFSNDVAAVICTDQPCTEGNFRTTGGDGVTNGRLEVCVGELWGAVCTTDFNDALASQACTSMGQQGTDFTLVPGSFFGASSRPTFTVTTPPGQYQEMPCETGENVGLFCLAQGEERVCRSGEVRLGGGVDASQGRVEVCFNNIWGTVCDDSWDDNAAAVVCRQLGLHEEGAVANFFEGGKSVPILLDDIKCTGEEATLFECSRTNVGRHNCQHNEDAGVVCTRKPVDAGSSSRITEAVAISVPIAVIVVILMVAITIVAILVIYLNRKVKSQQADITPIVGAEVGIPFDNEQEDPKKTHFNHEEQL